MMHEALVVHDVPVDAVCRWIGHLLVCWHDHALEATRSVLELAEEEDVVG
jgi:hypothetical protein